MGKQIAVHFKTQIHMRVDVDDSERLFQCGIHTPLHRDRNRVISSDHRETDPFSNETFNKGLHLCEDLIPVVPFEIAGIQNAVSVKEVQPFRAGCRMVRIGSQKVRCFRGSASVTDAAVIWDTEYDSIYFGHIRFGFIQTKPCCCV